ncbi:MAG: UdgX family uracil-DNA binding protein [Pseudomonadota bacterium]
MSAPIAISLKRAADYAEWRSAARNLVARGVAPDRVAFHRAEGTGDLFGAMEPAEAPAAVAASVRVPRAFPALAKQVLCHRDEGRFALLYRLLWRLRETPRLLDDASDRDVWAAERMAKAVRRDAHKMKAFVRFRRVEGADDEAYVAWFEPDHHIVERTAPFFARRFTGMRWSIVTPDVSAHWNGEALSFGDGASRRDCPDSDALEDHWRVYYASIFNAARLKVNAMRAEMPVKYWRNLPESRLIPELTRSAQRAQRAAPAGTLPSQTKAAQLVAAQPAMQVAVEAQPRSLDAVAQAVRGCTRCELCKPATMAVPGEGPPDARLMIVGEQPGDTEDLAGRPFVGPAGEVLDAALRDSGIARDAVYLTNAVKHFKHVVRGKQRLHQKPNVGEIEHCRWWLNLERELLAPRVTVALGATAARAVLGRPVKIAEVRGRVIEAPNGTAVIVTVHPAYLLRLPDASEAKRQRERFVEDLTLARSLATAEALASAV